MIALFALVAALMRAHDPRNEVIDRLTARIEADPGDVDALVLRGEMYRAEQQWANAFMDWNRAEARRPDLDLREQRARTYYELGRIELAREQLRGVRSFDGVLLRARVNREDGRIVAALEDYAEAIRAPVGPKTLDCYLERAALLMDPEAALVCLDDGIRRLGHAVQLELAAFDLEVRLKRWKAAIERLDRLEDVSPRAEAWRIKRAEVLIAAGWKRQAAKVLQGVLQRPNLKEPLRQRVTALLEQIGEG